MDHIYKEKKNLRHQFRKIRKEISPKRRKEAEDAGEQTLISITQEYQTNGYILSYSSIQDEFSLQSFNSLIASKNLLFLPKIVEDRIHIFHVKNIKKELVLNKLGILEPDTQLCEEVSISKVALILVPALAFDAAHHRLGYGGGFYDRFLSSIKRSGAEGLEAVQEAGVNVGEWAGTREEVGAGVSSNAIKPLNLEKSTTTLRTIGIGFQEQLYLASLPVTPSDITLDEVMLF